MTNDDHNREQLSDQFRALYTELKELAGHVWRSNPNTTLNRTALLNEAFVKLAGSSSANAAGKTHFKRLAASAMRKVLIDAARRRQSLKRGAGWVQVTVEDAADPRELDLDGLIALNDAIDALSALAPRQAEFVVLRFFGGLDVKEAAEELGISESAAKRDWRAARAWLSVELGDVDL